MTVLVSDKYSEDVLKDIMIIDQQEKLYWRNHEVMTESEFADCIKQGKDAEKRLNANGFIGQQIRDLWLEVVKPLYNRGVLK